MKLGKVMGDTGGWGLMAGQLGIQGGKLQGTHYTPNLCSSCQPT